MNIGERVRRLRRLKMLSQEDIEKRTGLLRCYTSRVENGTTVASIKTLEKLARALEVPLYQFFYDREGPPEPPIFPWQSSVERHAWAKSAKRCEPWSGLHCSVSWMTGIGVYCFPWPRRWPRIHLRS
jgi:transcriptional regulator with XRE-family HTH domain